MTSDELFWTKNFEGYFEWPWFLNPFILIKNVWCINVALNKDLNHTISLVLIKNRWSLMGWLKNNARISSDGIEKCEGSYVFTVKIYHKISQDLIHFVYYATDGFQNDVYVFKRWQPAVVWNDLVVVGFHGYSRSRSIVADTASWRHSSCVLLWRWQYRGHTNICWSGRWNSSCHRGNQDNNHYGK